MGLTVEKLHTEFILKLPYLLRKGALRHTHGAGSLRKAEQPRRFCKIS
jgi:hypothetical protein